jgi:hypothetical protein
VDVPSLRELRRLSGEADTINPVLVIERMLAAGELFTDRDCTRCGRADAATVSVTATCERSWTKLQRLARYLTPAVPWFARLLVRDEAADDPDQRFGQDVSLRLPLRLCPACRSDVRSAADVATVLREVPIYARLLDRYPTATLRLGGIDEPAGA